MRDVDAWAPRYEDLTEYRHRHANMRLRARYGMELTLKEYLALCRDFESGKAVAVEKGKRGDHEGWLLFRDKWVRAIWRPRDRLIATFVPAPPMPPAVAAAPKPGGNEKSPRNRKQQIAHILGQLALARARVIEASWYRAKAGEARNLIKEGRTLDALVCLEVLAGMPNRLRGSDSLEALFARRLEWAAGYFHATMMQVEPNE